MNVLIVAHPDDVALWFDDPDKYDCIVVVFLARTDHPDQTEKRAWALANHPLHRKITCLRLEESHYWRDKSDEARRKHEDNYRALCTWLRTLEADSVTTHNAQGEYGHADHKLVHKACMMTLDCPVNGRNPKLYREIRKVYEEAGCWTWD